MLEAYFALSGRMRRRGYLGYSLLLWVILLLLSLLAPPLINQARFQFLAKVSAFGLIGLFWMWSWAALSVKRLHDLDRPGWYFLLLVVAPLMVLYAIGSIDFGLSAGVFRFSFDGGLFSLF